MLRCSGQTRASPGFVPGMVFGAAVTIGTALCYAAIALAAFFPASESGLTNAINKRLQQ